MSPKNDDSQHDQPASKAKQRGAAKASRGLARETLEAALAHLRGGASGSCPQDPCSKAVQFQNEARALHDWAVQKGFTLACLKPAQDFGKEHIMWVGEDGRAWKSTYPNTFGEGPFFDYTLDHHQKYVPDYGIGPLVPSQYLERLLLARDVFGDDVRLEGVLMGKDGLLIITSQEYALGRDSTLAEIRGLMGDLGFLPLKEKRPDGVVLTSPYHYYNPDLNIAAFDAHEKNVIMALSGSLHPIDLMLSHPDDELRAVLLQKLSF